MRLPISGASPNAGSTTSDWVLWDCVERIKLRNKEFEEAQVAAAKRETEEGKVVSQHLRLTRTGPVQRRPVAAQSPSDVWRRWL